MINKDFFPQYYFEYSFTYLIQNNSLSLFTPWILKIVTLSQAISQQALTCAFLILRQCFFMITCGFDNFVMGFVILVTVLL